MAEYVMFDRNCKQVSVSGCTDLRQKAFYNVNCRSFCCDLITSRYFAVRSEAPVNAIL